MSYQHLVTVSGKDIDYSYKELIEGVVTEDDQAWSVFLEQFSRLIFSLVWSHARKNQDLCYDLYIFVVDGLCQSNEAGEKFFRLKRYLQSVDRYQGKGKFTTWLGKVTQNLVRDYFRKMDGRHTLPRAIQRLDEVSQQIFQLIYWRHYSEHETFEIIKCRGSRLSLEGFERKVCKINKLLRNCNRWSIYSEVLKRTPAQPICVDSNNDSFLQTPIQVADSNPASDPVYSSIRREQRAQSTRMGRVLRRYLKEMDPESRLLLLMKFRRGMTASQISKVLRRTNQKSIYSEIDRILRSLHRLLEKKGFEWSRAEQGVDSLDGMLDEFDCSEIAGRIGTKAYQAPVAAIA